ncbi:MAG: hypothetical protein KVP17_002736 [Porospora cf. gigantea B]|uniref:uncharacterized protein n=1 Tax=Porospora cf. gigantea B TaxID=2853592 RepID=UPI003571ED2A|nr:MAG: hypothetical protein KVP17_002736 [Porospora cf. gigantea B]
MRCFSINSTTYTVLNEIGRGGFAVVYRVHDAGGNPFAVKAIALGNLKAKAAALQELSLLSQLRGQSHVVQLRGHAITKDQVLLLMDLCEGPSALTRATQGMTDYEIRLLARDVSGALRNMHELGYIHFDVKLENVLWQADMWVLVDFGSCLQTSFDFGAMEVKEAAALRERLREISTPSYRPPELVNQLRLDAVLGPPSDMWMLGVMLLTAVLRRPPFDGNDTAILAGPSRFSQIVVSEFSTELWRLISSLLQREPLDRPTARAVLDSLSSAETWIAFPETTQAESGGLLHTPNTEVSPDLLGEDTLPGPSPPLVPNPSLDSLETLDPFRFDVQRPSVTTPPCPVKNFDDLNPFA